MKLMIAVSAVHPTAFEAVPWVPAANDYPPPKPARVPRVLRSHELSPGIALPLARGAFGVAAR